MRAHRPAGREIHSPVIAVLVGRTLVDASSWSARVMMVNPSSAKWSYLPSFSCVGYLVPVSAVSVACAESVLPEEGSSVLPEHLEDIITVIPPSLGEADRLSLRGLLHRYAHVFRLPESQ